ncbi:MAG: hypothetical protein ABL967_10685 [Bryobacteraceae bacterium]
MARFWLVYVTVLIAAGALLYAQGAAPGMGLATASVVTPGSQLSSQTGVSDLPTHPQ